MAPIPVTLVTGFLGAGKTSFLNAILEDPRYEGTAVLVNEFGEVSVDHDLVAGISGDLVSTTTGCLCCTASSDVKQALFDLWNRRKNREIQEFKRVIIETTGLADPAPVVASLLAPPTVHLMDRIFATQFALARVVTLVDALHGQVTIEKYPEPPKQIALADMVVMTKSDLMVDPASRSDTQKLAKQVESLNPTAQLYDRHRDWSQITNAIIESGTYDLRTKGEDALEWLAAERVLLEQESKQADHGAHSHGSSPNHSHHDHGHSHHDHSHHHHAHHDHDHEHHDVNRHHSGIETQAIVIDEPIEPARFNLFLQVMKLGGHNNLLRLKGLFKLADDPKRPVVVHGVQSQIHEIDRLEAWPSEDERTRLVLIGTNLDVTKISSIFTAKSKPASLATSD